MSEQPTAPRGLLLVLCSTGIVVSTMHTLIMPLVPRLPEIFDTDPGQAYWAVTATLLAAAAFTPIAGRLGDMFGKRRMLILCLLFLLAGCVLCAVADSVAVMIAGRALQGAASGAIALGISILRDELPPQRVGPAIALMSSSMGLGSAFGLPLAALIAQSADWHVLFWITAAMSAGCLALVVKLVPESPIKTPGRFDFVGAVGLAIGLVSLMVMITRGNAWGWTSPGVLSLAAVVLIVFPIWGWFQLRVSSPLVDLRVSARPQVFFTNLASVAVGFGMFGSSLLCIQVLMAPTSVSYGLGMSMAEAGLALAPGGFVMFFCSRVGAALSASLGPKMALLAGIVMMTVGYLQGWLFHDTLPEIMVCSVLVSGGIGFAFAAMPALIMGAVPLSETAAANGLNSLMRSLGSTTSSAIVSAVLAASVVQVGTAALPSAAAVDRAFVVCVGVCFLALALALLVPRRNSACASGELVEDRLGSVVAAEA